MSSVVYEWSSETIHALIQAMNLSLLEFANRLEVSEKTVVSWTAPGSKVAIRVQNRQRLDKLLTESPACVQARFDRLRKVGGPCSDLVARQEDPATLAIDTIGADDTNQVQVLARTPDGEVIVVELPRRAVVTGIGAAALTAAIGGRPAAAAPAVTAETDWISHFRTLRMSLIDSDNLCGSGPVIPLMEHNIAMLGQLRRAGAADPIQLLRMRILYGEGAAWLHQDAQTWSRAEHWVNKAGEWSLALKDPASIALVSIRKAQIACDRGDGEAALDSAEAAAMQAPPRSRFGAVATLFTAWGHALLRDARASAAAFDRARELAATADHDSDWGFFLDEAYVEVHQATAALRLGNHTAAIPQFERAIASMPGTYARDRGVYNGRLALAHAAAGDHAAAAAIGVEAMRTGVATGSQRVLAPVRKLSAVIDASSADQHIREFLDAADRWSVKA